MPGPKLQQLVSIIIPTKNRCSLLLETLGSVRGQTYTEWEAIVVDDLSEDDTWPKLEEIAGQDSRIRPILQTGTVGGAAAARNLGFTASRGSFVVFLDSDDLLAATAIENRLKTFYQFPEADAIVGDNEYFRHFPGEYSAECALGNRLLNDVDPLDAFLTTWSVWITSGPLWRRAAVERIGPWKTPRDNHYHLNALAMGVRFVRTGKTDWFWRLHRGPQVSRSAISDQSLNIELLNDKIRLLRTHRLLTKRTKRMLAWSALIQTLTSAYERVPTDPKSELLLWRSARDQHLIGAWLFVMGMLLTKLQRLPILGPAPRELARFVVYVDLKQKRPFPFRFFQSISAYMKYFVRHFGSWARAKKSGTSLLEVKTSNDLKTSSTQVMRAPSCTLGSTAISIPSRPKVVIGHPMMGLGGSESNVMWLIEALKGGCDVTIMTTQGWDLDALNTYYGTRIRQNEIKVRIAPIPILARSLSVAALRGSCYQRFARQIAAEYDVRISAYNPTDWGLPAAHFIADFTWHKEIRERFDPPTPGFIYRDSILRKAYLGITSTYARPSGRDFLRDDLLIANSRWTAGRIKEYSGVDCAAIVYHPVWAEFPEVPWEEKEQAFVMIGRIAPEKRVEQAIAILEAVRQRGHAIRFHICGHIGDDLYGRRIAQLCQERADWIIAEGRVSGTKKAQILARCRFGIQAREAEPFGIAVAEMVKAGAIVFAHNDGGQTEILDHSLLLFDSDAQAVEKICTVLDDARIQLELRNHLRGLGVKYSPAAFIQASRKIVSQLLQPA